MRLWIFAMAAIFGLVHPNHTDGIEKWL